MKKINIMKIMVIIINVILVSRLFYLMIYNNSYYSFRYNDINNKIVYLGSAKRGRIFDINGNILVDNKVVKSLYYKGNDISKIDEVSSIINYDEEYVKQLINNGYKYDYKLIKSDLSYDEIELLNIIKPKDFYILDDYKRVYNYDTSLNDLFGSVGLIPKEELKNYLDKGYSLDDYVGVSFLEKYYDEYLRGVKAKYILKDDNSLYMLEPSIKGNDLVLSIDINKQIEIDNVLKKEMRNAKKYPTSKFYDGSYIVVSNPKDGAIVCISAYRFDGDNLVSNTIGALTNSFTVGSIVKGASQTVGYTYSAIDINKKVFDSCVKLYSQNKKCSWKNLGYLSDIDALAFSSNYYQFINAIKVSGNAYKYNMKFNPSIDDFNKYRDIFKLYGLGSKTYIDLYEEKEGIVGSKISGDLLLNLSIGQYDTYTPVMINSYISTIANDGKRNKLRLVSYMVNNDGKKVDINKEKVLNEVKLESLYFDRIKKGFRKSVTNGTSYSYIDEKYKGAGKTGTSETFYNGIKTNTKSFVSFIPYDNPRYAIDIISPNVYTNVSANNSKYPINLRISRQITNILFEK